MLLFLKRPSSLYHKFKWKKNSFLIEISFFEPFVSKLCHKLADLLDFVQTGNNVNRQFQAKRSFFDFGKVSFSAEELYNS